MTDLPETLPGHWATAEGRIMAERYAGMAREDLAAGSQPDFQLANAVYLAGRSDLDLIGLQTAAKERIRWLSAQLAIALAKAAAAPPNTTGSPEQRRADLINRLRGRYAMGPLGPDGEPEFGWRVFDRLPNGEPFPAIHAEAADALSEASSTIARLKEPDVALIASGVEAYNLAIDHQYSQRAGMDAALRAMVHAALSNPQVA